MKTKLTLVSVTFKGTLLSMFVDAPIIEGQAVVSSSLINKMLENLGCWDRGLTYSVG